MGGGSPVAVAGEGGAKLPSTGWAETSGRDREACVARRARHRAAEHGARLSAEAEPQGGGGCRYTVFFRRCDDLDVQRVVVEIQHGTLGIEAQRCRPQRQVERHLEARAIERPSRTHFEVGGVSILGKRKPNAEPTRGVTGQDDPLGTVEGRGLVRFRAPFGSGRAERSGRSSWQTSGKPERDVRPGRRPSLVIRHRSGDDELAPRETRVRVDSCNPLHADVGPAAEAAEGSDRDKFRAQGGTEQKRYEAEHPRCRALRGHGSLKSWMVSGSRTMSRPGVSTLLALLVVLVASSAQAG